MSDERPDHDLDSATVGIGGRVYTVSELLLTVALLVAGVVCLVLTVTASRVFTLPTVLLAGWGLLRLFSGGTRTP